MSRFRALDADGRGAGGKAPRRRHPAASPYIRPELPPLPSSDDPPPLRGWLTGFVSGAGRLLSAVFGSDSSESDVSSCSFSDDDTSDYAPSDDFDDEDCRYAPDVNRDLDQPGMNLALVEDQTLDHVPLASMSKSEHLIEELIWQETFTRSECKKLIEIIQSRVVDSPQVNSGSCPLYSHRRSFCSNIASSSVTGLGPNYGPIMKSPVHESFLRTGSPKSFVDQMHSPEICDRVVMQAKKWVEKRTETSNTDLGRGPCLLNTEMYRYDSDSERGSPVAMSKSYMRVLPPWQSPRIMATGFSSPSIEACREKYEYLNSVFPTLSSLKSTTRNSFSGGLWDTIDSTQEYHRRDIKNLEMPQRTCASCTPASSWPDVHMKLPRGFSAKNVCLGVESARKSNYSPDNKLFGKTRISDDHIQISREETSNIIVMEGSCPTKEKVASSMHCKVAVVDASCTELNGDNLGLVEDFTVAEPIAAVPENSFGVPTRSPDIDVDLIIDRDSSGMQRSFEPGRSSSQMEAVDTSDDDNEERDYDVAGIITQSLDGPSPADFSSLPVSVDAANCISSLRSEEHGSTVFDNGHLKENGGHQDANKMHSGTTVKSIKKMLRDNPPSLQPRCREKRTSTKPRRGRGRGRGGRRMT